MSKFAELGLCPEIVQGVTALGFEEPTPVQAKTVPMLLESDKDLVALAQTGTGKTAAFGLPMLNRIDVNDKTTQAIVLCPTRELCLQISRDFENFTKFMPKLNVLAVYGGTPIDKQIRTLKKGVQVIVATPGRMNDLIRRKCAKLANVERVVLDEADEMLNMGFLEELESILSNVPDFAQTLLFSATMPRQVANIAKNYMTDPDEITIGTKNAGAKNVTHECYMVHARDRYAALKRLADLYPDMYGIVFCRTRAETQDVASKLMADGYNADAIHGDLSQAQRDRVMDQFRGKKLQMLVATDVAARGLDVTELTHVINYNLPDDVENYTHRSGRTGRAGNKGTSVVIINMREKGKIKRIEQIMKTKFIVKQIPTGEEVCEAQLLSLVDRVKTVKVDHEHIDKFLPAIFDKFAGMEKEELIKHFVSLEFNRFLNYYKNAADLNTSSDRGKNKSTLAGDSSRLFINLGKMDRMSPKDLLGLINQCTPDYTVTIGAIDLKEKFSFFEVLTKDLDVLLPSINGASFNDRKVACELVKESDRGGDRGGRGGDRRNRGGRGGERRDRGGRGGERRDRGGDRGGRSKSKREYGRPGEKKTGNRRKRD